jgi:hypothetical protein
VSDKRFIVRPGGGRSVKIARRPSDCFNEPASLTRRRPVGQVLHLNSADCSYDDSTEKMNSYWTEDGIWQANEMPMAPSFSRQNGGSSDMTGCYTDQLLNISDFDKPQSYNCDVESSGVPAACQWPNVGYSRRSLGYATDTSSDVSNRVEQALAMTDFNANVSRLPGDNTWSFDCRDRKYSHPCPVNQDCFDERNVKYIERTAPVARRIALLPDPVDCPKVQCDSATTDSGLLTELLDHVESLITLYHKKQAKTRSARNASTGEGDYCEPHVAPPPSQPRLLPNSTVCHTAFWTNESSGVNEPPNVVRGRLLGNGQLMRADRRFSG